MTCHGAVESWIDAGGVSFAAEWAALSVVLETEPRNSDCCACTGTAAVVLDAWAGFDSLWLGLSRLLHTFAKWPTLLHRLQVSLHTGQSWRW